MIKCQLPCLKINILLAHLRVEVNDSECPLKLRIKGLNTTQITIYFVLYLSLFCESLKYLILKSNCQTIKYVPVNGTFYKALELIVSETVKSCIIAHGRRCIFHVHV